MRIISFTRALGRGHKEPHILDIFDFRPAAIIKKLNLKYIEYKRLAAYGHFGRSDYPWEKTDKVSDLKNKLENDYA